MIRLVGSFLTAVALFVPLLGQGAEFTARTEQICPGLEYVHWQEKTAPWSIHVAKFDWRRNEFKLVTTTSTNHLLGLSPSTEQIKAIPAAEGHPLAVLNGDFFSWPKGPYQGDPEGLQICHGELISSPTASNPKKDRGQVFWMDTHDKPQLARVHSKFAVVWPNGKRTPFSLNEGRTNDTAVLCTPLAGASTRLTYGVEYVLEPVRNKPLLPLKPGEVYLARVRAISRTDTAIPTNGLVLSVGSKLLSSIPKVRVGDILVLSTGTTPDLRGVDHAIGGGPVFLRHGKLVDFPHPLERHPRTALGWNDESFFFVVVDGRRKDVSVGMTFVELANEMKRLGCTDAMNLDGGGSAMLWVNGAIRNQPSENRERPCANALVLLTKKKLPEKTTP